MRRTLTVAIVAGLALAPAIARAQAPQFLNTNPQSTAPFSSAVRVGNMLYLAGQIGTDKGKLVEGGIGPETRQALTNIKTVLEANGSDMAHVVKCTVFLADMKEWGAMNEVYRTMFTAGKFPARSAFGTTGLANDARTEIECMAVVKRVIGALLLALGAGPRLAPAVADSAHGSVVTDTLWSQALGVKKAVIVYLPPSYAKSPAQRFPVAYYLHGLGGNESDWTQRGQLNEVMDSLITAGGPEMIVVMPDGDDGWYTTWNSLVTVETCRKTAPARESAATYCVPWQHYDDYIARDVVQFTDTKYRTRADRRHRAIAGLSMGGYGTMALAFEYPELFAAAASHSGVLAPLYAGPDPFDGHPQWAASGAALETGFGKNFWPLISPAFGRDTAAWWSRDPGRRLEKLVAKRGKSAVPALFADCGTEDGLVNENRAFKWRAEQVGVPIVYHEWPGRHEWPYWRAHVGESLHWIGAQIGK